MAYIGLGEGFAVRSSVCEPRGELLERVDDRRLRVIARPEAAAAAGWADGTSCAGPKAGGALPASTGSAEQKLAKPPAAAPRVSIERAESSVEAAGWGARWGWSRSPKAWRAPHAELSGRDEHDAPCRASRGHNRRRRTDNKTRQKERGNEAQTRQKERRQAGKEQGGGRSREGGGGWGGGGKTRSRRKQGRRGAEKEKKRRTEKKEEKKRGRGGGEKKRRRERDEKRRRKSRREEEVEGKEERRRGGEGRAIEIERGPDPEDNASAAL
jgi:hypothetical protein